MVVEATEKAGYGGGEFEAFNEEKEEEKKERTEEKD